MRQYSPMNDLPIVYEQASGVRELLPGFYRPHELDFGNAGVDWSDKVDRWGGYI